MTDRFLTAAGREGEPAGRARGLEEERGRAGEAAGAGLTFFPARDSVPFLRGDSRSPCYSHYHKVRDAFLQYLLLAGLLLALSLLPLPSLPPAAAAAGVRARVAAGLGRAGAAGAGARAVLPPTETPDHVCKINFHASQLRITR